MTIRIYSTTYTTPLPREILDPLLAILPEEISAKARRYRLWQDTHGCIFGRLLLAEALRDQGHAAPLHHLQYTPLGRPYLPDTPDFNISHSAHRVVCAMASRDGRIGIDLEEIKHVTIEDFKDQFSPQEWLAITHAADPLLAFYHYWTAKESLIKADGRGLNLPLADLAVVGDKPILLDGRTWRLQTITHFPGYACHIASGSPADEVVIKELTHNELSISVLENHRNYPT